MAICSTMDGARHFSMANTCNPREKNVSRIPIACHYVYGDIWGSRCKVSSASLLAWQFNFSLLSLELEKIMQRGKMTWLKFKFWTFYNENGKRKTENEKRKNVSRKNIDFMRRCMETTKKPASASKVVRYYLIKYVSTCDLHQLSH